MPLTDELINHITLDAIAYDGRDPHRVQHFLKVYAFSRTIGIAEGMDEDARRVLELAALLHDIGIRESERKYGSAAGPYQEQEGPPIAREMLEKRNVPAAVTDRVCTLIGRHHTYTDVDGLDCRILLEADFLVNIHEGQMNKEQIAAARDLAFRTETGCRLLDGMFGGVA